MSGTKIQGRHRWMDFLRGVAVLLVVAWHVFAVPALYGVDVPAGVRSFFAATAVVRIPMLFALSGMLLSGAVQKSPGKYMAGKLRNVLWPFVVWTLITIAASGRWGMLASPWTWVGGQYHLWFLAVLLPCLVIGYVTRWVPAWVLLVGVVGIDLAWDPGTKAIERFLFHAAFYFAGATIWPLLIRLRADSWAWPRWAPIESVGRSSIVWYVAHFAPMLVVCRALAGMAAPAGLYVACAVVGYGVPALLAWKRAWWPWLFAAPGPHRAMGPGSVSTPG